MRARCSFPLLLVMVCVVLAAPLATPAADVPVQPILKVENFAKDPQWEGRNNHIVSTQKTLVTQDFGYRATHFAGKEQGEIGGHIQRASVPAYHADTIHVKTLDDPLNASGTFAVTAATAASGVFFGYFNAQQPGATDRPIASLGLHLDFTANGGHLTARLVTRGNRSCGAAITSRTGNAPIKTDGTPYQWKLTYDPRANDGDGRFQFTLKSAAANAKPASSAAQVLSVDLPPGYKKEGATFDRFGLMNLLQPGGAATVYCDDLQYDGKTEDFSIDPNWVSVGNRTVHEDDEQPGAHLFGFDPATNNAEGAPGEIGGIVWRTASSWAQYADRIEPVTLDQPLEAAGKVMLVGARPDSDLYIGWFSSADVDVPPVQGKNFLGVHLSGSPKHGHRLAPAYATAKGARGEKLDKAPVLIPGEGALWSLAYDPTANAGSGEIRVTLGAETVVLPLKAGHRKEGGRFDRFGLFSGYPRGQMLHIYFDDLSYSVGTNLQAAPSGGLGKN